MEKMDYSFKLIYIHLDSLMLFEVNSYIINIPCLTIGSDLSMSPIRQISELTEAIDLFIELNKK
jgi:hypothetical protein